MKKYRLFLLVIAALLTGCYDSGFSEPDFGAVPEEQQPATSTIRYLRGIYAGTTFRVESDVAVDGVVTTSDASENFYRTLCVEADGAALEVMVGIDQSHNDFPVGCSVMLRLKGLAVGESYGILQVGNLPVTGSGYATDYLRSQEEVDAALVRRDETLNPPMPAVLTLDELTPALCGTLVRIEALHYVPEDLTSSVWAGYQRFTDDAGREIYTYVRDYADFADRDVPVTRCALTGILQYTATNGRYSLKLRDENDCEVY